MSFSLLRRSFHSIRPLYQEAWTKTSLKKLKKNELLQLAKQHHVQKVMGTKNDIIDQLLSLQEKKNKQDEFDKDWVNAFESKVAHRIHKKQVATDEPKPSSKPHPLNDNIFRTKPVTVTSEEEETVDQPVIDEFKHIDEKSNHEGSQDEIDQKWVEAFELKVNSRTSKRREQQAEPVINRSIDIESTLEDDIKDVVQNEQDSKKETAKNDQAKDTVQNVENKAKDTVQSVENKANNTLISSMIGTSLLVWYIGGQEGFIKIWEFISS